MTWIGFLCSIAYFLAFYSLPYFTIRMSGNHNVEWGRMFTYCVICYASITLLPTPGGSGGAELSFRSIFESYLSGGILFWSMLSWRILSYYIYIFLGLGIIIYQQIISIAKGEKRKKKVEIQPEDELELYTPIPATIETAEDDINTAVPLTVAEATLEPDVDESIIPEIIDNEPVEFESVAEFTAVIESKSTVTITEEHIEIQEKPAEEEHQISFDELISSESTAHEAPIDNAPEQGATTTATAESESILEINTQHIAEAINKLDEPLKVLSENENQSTEEAQSAHSDIEENGEEG